VHQVFDAQKFFAKPTSRMQGRKIVRLEAAALE
jgi:hypothetical protein